MFWNLFESAQDMNNETDKKIKDAVKPGQDDINFLQSMQKLEVKEGDIVVLHHPYKLSGETTRNLQNAIEATIRAGGFNVKVMALEDGMDIGILRKVKKKWIDIKEGLPSKDGLYLIYAPSLDKEKPLIQCAWYDPNGFRWSGLVDIWLKAITHWMPLPKPPRKEKNDKEI